MTGKSLLELESLLSGKKDAIEITVESTSVIRDEIVSKLNELMIDILPGSWFEGEFINKDDCDYMIYDLHLARAKKTDSFSSIRLIDFGDKFKLMRV